VLAQRARPDPRRNRRRGQTQWQTFVEEDVRDREKQVICEGPRRMSAAFQLEAAADMSDGPLALAGGAPLDAGRGRVRFLKAGAAGKEALWTLVRGVPEVLADGAPQDAGRIPGPYVGHPDLNRPEALGAQTLAMFADPLSCASHTTMLHVTNANHQPSRWRKANIHSWLPSVVSGCQGVVRDVGYGDSASELCSGAGE
jgi:hypothetical protein